MASVAVEYTGTPFAEHKISENAEVEANETRFRKKAHDLELQTSHEEEQISENERLDKGYMQYGYVLLILFHVSVG